MDRNREQSPWRRALIDYLEASPQVLLAFLFGSQARGAARPGSDVDVAVYLREPYTEEEVSTLWGEIERLVRREVDLVVLNAAPPGIAWTAFQGEVLVKKDSRLYLEKMLDFSREAEEIREMVFELVKLRRRLRGEG